MTTQEIAVLISIVSVCFAIYSGLRGNKRADTHDAEIKAAEQATINIKLDQIGGDVRDIKYDMTDIKKEVQSLTERMVAVEKSTSSAHKRLDFMEGKEREERYE